MLDLGDFVPQEIEFSFSIKGNKYEFAIEEAHVDEVIRIMAEKPEEKTVDALRRSLSQFLSKYVSEDRREQFKADLSKVPYTSQNGRISLVMIHSVLQGRFLSERSPGEKSEAN